MSIFSKIIGDSNERFIKGLKPLVDKINQLEPQFESFSLEKLKAKTEEFKKEIENGKSLDDILPEAFALAREAAKRTLNQRHFDVQLLGGIALHQGKIAEMKTGEGKTLTATLAVYLNALLGKGTHVVTVNDYLAKRDMVWMGQIYHFLGLAVGCINHESSYIYDPSYINQNKGQENEISNFQFSISKQIPNSKSQIPNDERDEKRDVLGGFKVEDSYLRPCSRKEAYRADILYGTNNEFGFDYLRDNLVHSLDEMVQREHYFAIVDEVDSILIDEARTPLIISAPDAESTKMYETFARLVPRLKENIDYNVDEKMRAVTLTQQGIDNVEKMLGMGNIYEEGGVRLVHHLEQALKANILFKKDKDYVVAGGAAPQLRGEPRPDGREVIIVDEFTGRLMPGRRYSEGLHQAIEAKEGVEVQKESRTVASITFQNYFRMYEKLAGMTGTAATNAEEFHKVYNLDVIIAPTNKPMIRRNLQDSIYRTEKGKFQAVVREIKERREKGQPVLVGTVSIERNEHLSALLKKEGIKHEILNAKHHEREGEIIAQAGRLGAITIATNMAGRGVDIVLGGNPADPDEQKKVIEFGGLHVIGTERHEARRIDNQLRGRSGRQGDPGSSQFFVSMEDDLMRIFGSDKMKRLMEVLKVPEDMPIENKFISRAIESAQAKIEGYNFDIRKHLLEYDDVMNKHREVIYKRRKEILETSPHEGYSEGRQNLKSKIQAMIEDEIKKLVDFHTQGEHPEAWNIEEIRETANTIFSLPGEARSKLEEIKTSSTPEKILPRWTSGEKAPASILPLKEGEDERRGRVPKTRKDILREYLISLAHQFYETKEKEVSEESMRQIEKFVLLRTIDELWMDHLDEMEHLRDSVRLRAYGQRDPLVEYKNEGHRMFQGLLASYQSSVVGMIFKIGIKSQNRAEQYTEPRVNNKLDYSSSGAPTQGVEAESRSGQVSRLSKSTQQKIGRNDPCPCGAKKSDGNPIKYKHCHGK